MIRSLTAVAASVFVIGCAAATATAQTPAPAAPAPAAPAAAAPAAAPAAAAAPVEFGPDGLPTGPTHDVVLRVCSACHAPEIVVDKRMDYAGWDDLVQTMIGRGAQATPEEAKAITDYLAKGFPAKAG